MCDEHERPVKRSVLAAIVDRAKARRQRLLFMATHESDGIRYIGFNDGRSVRRWIFSKDTIDPDILAQALGALVADEGRDLLIMPTGPVVFPCRLLARAWRSNETKVNDHRVRL